VSEQLVGDLDPSLSDQVILWKGNVLPANYTESYGVNFYVPGNGTTRPDGIWVDVSDFLLSSKNTDSTMFPMDRAVFILRRAATCDIDFKLPANWTQ